MKLSPDDPKLTAYALGELDAAERAAIEAALADSPEARAALEEIRATAERLTSDLAAEPCPELTPQQCAALASPAAKVVPFPTWRVWRTAGIAAAAACVLGLAGWALFRPELVTRHERVESQRVVVRDYSPQSPHPIAGFVPATPNAQTASHSNNQSGPAAPLNGTGFTRPIQLASADNDVSLGPPHFTGDSTSIAFPSPAAIDEAVAKLNQSQAALYANSGTPGFRLRVNGGTGGGNAPATLSGDAGLPTGMNPTAPRPPPVNGWSFQSDDKKRRDRPAEYASASAGSRFLTMRQQRQQGVWREQNPSSVSHVEFTPDGRRILTATDEKTVRIWDAQTGRPLTQPITAYAPFVENAFVPVYQEPLSTFSIDVDTASYANVRRFLNSGQLPRRDAVRIEELVNYFSYAYPAPRGEDPFSASIETAGCPWAPEHRLVRVALRGRELPRGKRPPSNFVFLIDVSGSMQPPERLPLLKQGLRALVKKMGEGDRAAIVVYASEAGVKLESTSCTEKEKILAVIDALEAGGSTNGGEGIQQAYTMARKNFIQGGVNRVLLCTDGDFNVGITDQNALVALVKENAATGVFLTTLGVGTDNYKDALMQRLADRANGNYHYLDTLEEANKVLVEQMNANLVTIAKDVKIQVEFNPAQVSAYRLIGYEKRLLRAPDFNNDRKDAGEIGAGHTVTAFYEIVPAGVADVRPVVDRLKYQSAVAPASYSEKGEQSKELLTLKLRYKQPDGDTSKLIEFPHTDGGGSYGKASGDFKFAASVASFGMILRGSEHKGSATFDTVLELAEEGKGTDDGGWRSEFINLVKKAKGLHY